VRRRLHNRSPKLASLPIEGVAHVEGVARALLLQRTSRRHPRRRLHGRVAKRASVSQARTSRRRASAAVAAHKLRCRRHTRVAGRASTDQSRMSRAWRERCYCSPQTEVQPHARLAGTGYHLPIAHVESVARALLLQRTSSRPLRRRLQTRAGRRGGLAPTNRARRGRGASAAVAAHRQPAAKVPVAC
jgi:hypothetical protein